MLLDQHSHSFLKTRQAFSHVLSPVQAVAQWPWRWHTAVAGAYETRHQLAQENAVLKQQLALANAKNQQLVALQQQNQQLRASLQFSQHASLALIPVSVTHLTGYPYLRRLSLNKGLAAGVKKGAAVFAKQGIAGQVIAVTAGASQLLPLTSSKSAIPVKAEKSGVSAIARGDGQLGLRIAHLAKTSPVAVGDTFVTSGLGQRFPANYPVAVVTARTVSADGAFLVLQLKPLVNLAKSQYLFVNKGTP